ncbi:MAG: hypothetical protein WCV86_05335, partial [Patescibacteria group bacterium]
EVQTRDIPKKDEIPVVVPVGLCLERDVKVVLNLTENGLYDLTRIFVRDNDGAIYNEIHLLKGSTLEGLPISSFSIGSDCWVYFDILEGSKPNNIWKVSVGGWQQGLVQLTDDSSVANYDVAFSDYRAGTLVFVKDRELFSMNTSGGDVKSLGLNGFHPVVSQDGKKFAFYDGTVYIARLDDGTVVNTGLEGAAVDWDQSGDGLFYFSFADDQLNKLVFADGSSVRAGDWYSVSVDPRFFPAGDITIADNKLYWVKKAGIELNLFAQRSAVSEDLLPVDRAMEMVDLNQPVVSDSQARASATASGEQTFLSDWWHVWTENKPFFSGPSDDYLRYLLDNPVKVVSAVDQESADVLAEVPSKDDPITIVNTVESAPRRFVSYTDSQANMDTLINSINESVEAEAKVTAKAQENTKKMYIALFVAGLGLFAAALACVLRWAWKKSSVR